MNVCTWFGWFCLYIYGSVWVATNIYHGVADSGYNYYIIIILKMLTLSLGNTGVKEEQDKFDAGIRTANLGLALQCTVFSHLYYLSLLFFFYFLCSGGSNYFSTNIPMDHTCARAEVGVPVGPIGVRRVPPECIVHYYSCVGCGHVGLAWHSLDLCYSMNGEGGDRERAIEGGSLLRIDHLHPCVGCGHAGIPWTCAVVCGRERETAEEERAREQK